MATRLKKPPRKTGRIGRPEKYPWDSWADGTWWIVSKGSDFKTSVESFRRLLHAVAERRGLAVEYERDGDKISFRFKTTRRKAVSNR